MGWKENLTTENNVLDAELWWLNWKMYLYIYEKLFVAKSLSDFKQYSLFHDLFIQFLF